MSGGSTKRQWDRLGRTDPLWAVLTDPQKRGRKWDVGEFFQIGEEEVAFVLAHLATLGVRLPRGRALDFGCGVGRLTRALAARFERCDGVDVAPSMIREAVRLNRDVPRAVFHLNQRDDLGLFGDGTFAFVYSALVLQHMPRESAERFMRELFRVLAPGGAAVFQLPAPAFHGAAPAEARRTVAVALLPEGAFRARISAGPLSPTLTPVERVVLMATIENLSPHALPSLGPADSHLQLKLGSRWLDPDGKVVTGAGEGRTELPFDLAPGGVVTLEVRIDAPAAPGPCTLEIDLVQEDHAWFGERGSVPCRLACEVAGVADATLPPPQQPRPRFVEGFRTRFPRLHRIFTLLGIVPLYRRATRAREAARLAAARMKRRRSILMEMNAVPTSDVESIIREAGAVLLEIEREPEAMGLVSCRYWCTKPDAVTDVRPTTRRD